MTGNRRFDVGDPVVTERGEHGTVVGIIERAEYASRELEHRFAPLRRGIVVQTPDGEISHWSYGGIWLHKAGGGALR